MARKLTGKPSSVFPVPSREAVQIAAQMKGSDNAYETVAEVNQSSIGKGLCKQSFNISGTIDQADQFLNGQESLAMDGKILESYPEVCFAGLSGGNLAYSKKSAWHR